jgi:UDP-N-acetylglucosamine--N-acetylmuramyl-(pentapeptide) pyrophosphoryl-undecaprenol N-acetylglucosamine transferase
MNMIKNNSRAFVAGKSGGHIIPAITLAQDYKKQHPNADILFFSGDSALDKNLVSHENWTHVALDVPNFPRKNIMRYPQFIYLFIRACVQSVTALRRARIKSVVSTGGYISIPVCFAAKLLGIPYDLYEFNVMPGAAVTLLARWAHGVYVTFAEAKKYISHNNIIVVDYPIRKGLSVHAPAESRAVLGLSPDMRVIFVMGGSQGSQALNAIMMKYVALGACDNMYIIHQTGAHAVEDVRAYYARHGVQHHVFSFEKNLSLYYSASDLIITRAGAGSLFEILYLRKKAIVIPLVASTTDHQVANAQVMAERHPELFVCLFQADIEKNISLFADRVQYLLL